MVLQKNLSLLTFSFHFTYYICAKFNSIRQKKEKPLLSLFVPSRYQYEQTLQERLKLLEPKVKRKRFRNENREMYFKR